MIINDIAIWAKENAGKRVRVMVYSTDNRDGIVVGYQLNSLRIIVYNNCFTHRYNNPDGNVLVKTDIPLNESKFGWVYPSQIIEILETSAIKHDKGIKTINEWPHQCPNCKGPAYIGFSTTIDCQAKCLYKSD